MRFEFLRDGKLHAVDLDDLTGGRYRVSWTLRELGDESADEVLAERAFEMDVEELEGGGLSALVGNAVHDARVSRSGATRTVTLDGCQTGFEYLDPYRATGAAGPDAASGRAELVSPMPGRLVELRVVVGDDVEEGQTVLVVEAMKMANEYRAPLAGRVTAVHVAEGEAVEAGTPILVIEARPS